VKPHFLFPASPLNPRVIDEAFFDQAVALKQAGFGTSVFSIEANRLTGAIPEDAAVVYRGWMMSGAEYEVYESWLAGVGHKAFTSREQYLATHYLPNWYPLLKRWTPDSVSFGNSPETAERVYNFCLGAFSAEGFRIQVKDYVKSLKTDGGSVATSADEVREILAKMEKYRGAIEGGVVLRKYEEFIPDSERRYFVVNGRYFSQDSAFDIRHMRILARVHDVVPSPFYSVDIAQPKDNDYEARLVEIGDGQVSDLVGWTPERFAEIWK
jgi:hypothetical protein